MAVRVSLVGVWGPFGERTPASPASEDNALKGSPSRRRYEVRIFIKLSYFNYFIRIFDLYYRSFSQPIYGLLLGLQRGIGQE